MGRDEDRIKTGFYIRERRKRKKSKQQGGINHRGTETRRGHLTTKNAEIPLDPHVT
jgi:hypothetical protein